MQVFVGFHIALLDITGKKKIYMPSFCQYGALVKEQNKKH